MLLIFVMGRFTLVSKLFIDGILCKVALAPIAKTMTGVTFHPFYCNVVDERLVFCCFDLEGFRNKSTIAVCKFDKLYDEFWCRVSWWGVIVWVAYDTK